MEVSTGFGLFHLTSEKTKYEKPSFHKFPWGLKIHKVNRESLETLCWVPWENEFSVEKSLIVCTARLEQVICREQFIHQI